MGQFKYKVLRYTVTLYDGKNIRDMVFTNTVTIARNKFNDFCKRIDGTKATLVDNESEELIKVWEWV